MIVAMTSNFLKCTWLDHNHKCSRIKRS